MASGLPIPAPPRTPTPPTPNPEEEGGGGLGIIDGASRSAHVQNNFSFDRNTLSPIADLSPQFGSMSSPLQSPAGVSPDMSSDGAMAPPPPRNPFNFQTQTIKDMPVAAKSVSHKRHLLAEASSRAS